MWNLARLFRRLLLLAVVAVIAVVLLWQSGHVQQMLVRTPWARQLAEGFATDALDQHRQNLGALNYWQDHSWRVFPDSMNQHSDWPGHLNNAARFERLAPGVFGGRLKLKHTHGTEFDAVVLKVDLAEATLRALVNDENAATRAFVHEMSRESNAIAAINAGYFDSAGALGLVQSQTHVLRSANRVSGYLQIQEGHLHIGAQGVPDADEGVQSRPVLLEKGQLASRVANGSVDRRSAAGLTADSSLLLVTTDTDLAGLTFRQLADVMLGLGALDALALDGGGSAQLHTRNPDYVVEGWDPVPVALGIFPRSRNR